MQNVPNVIDIIEKSTAPVKSVEALERVDQPAQPSPLSAPTWKYGRGPERAAHRGVDSDDLPIYKPALDEVVKRGRGRNLFLSTEVQGAIKQAISSLTR